MEIPGDTPQACCQTLSHVRPSSEPDTSEEGETRTILTLGLPKSPLCLQELQEKLSKAAEVEKDLMESNARLQNHISDLESRKRAPLYQKKQEEELRAVTEKAHEAEVRAQEAEAKFKEAKVTPSPPLSLIQPPARRRRSSEGRSRSRSVWPHSPAPGVPE